MAMIHLRLALCVLFLAAGVEARSGSWDDGASAPLLLGDASVRMLSLDVEAVIERGSFPGKSWTWRSTDRVTYDLRVVLRNPSDEPVTFRVGFPVSGYWSTDSREEAALDGLVRFHAFSARDDGHTYHPRLQPSDDSKDLPRCLAWSMALEGRETRELRISCRIPTGNWEASTLRKNEFASHLWLGILAEALRKPSGFDLSTVKTWTGAPERVRLRFEVGRFEAWLARRGWSEMPDSDEPRYRPCVHTTVAPAATSCRDGVLEWRFTDELPDLVTLDWWITRLPRAPGGVPLLVRDIFGEEACRENLESLRQVILAYHGVEPRSAAIRAFAARQVWFEPRKGLVVESALPEDVRAVLAAVDRLARSTTPRGEMSASDLTGEGFELPTADTACRLSEERVRKMLVLRVKRDGSMTAIRLDGNEVLPIRSWDELKKRLCNLADMSREPEAPYASRQEVLLLADRRTPWDRILPPVFATTHPDVRIYRTWFAARDHEGRLAALPLFTPKDRGLCADPPPDAPPIIRKDLGLGATKGAGGFRDTSLLHHWFRRLHGEYAGKRVFLEIHFRPSSRVPFEQALAVFNEARRFGLEIHPHVGWESPSAPAPAPEAVPGWFSAGDSPPRPDPGAPALVPGRVIAGDPPQLVYWTAD
jgi:hypothetical protein